MSEEELDRLKKPKHHGIHKKSSIDPELVNFEIDKMIRRASLMPRNPLMISEDFEEFSDAIRDMPLTEDTTCGIWFLKGSFLQKFANKKAYVFLYGLMGCIYSATFAYFNGTITTLEKRFKIPSRTTGLISVAGDICQIFMSIVLSYYAGKGHKPRWIAFGNLTTVLFCLLTALPHLLFGPGRDALSLTREFGRENEFDSTNIILDKQKRKTLCHIDGDEECEEGSGSFYPQLILFAAQFVSGIGGSLYYSLGISYMDDNIQKSKSPLLISISYFLRMLGPAVGYALASFCLKFYISLDLTPTITLNDPRWLGAWWLGWIVLAVLISLFGSLIALFPKVLPREAMRRAMAKERYKGIIIESIETPPSIKDLFLTLKRLLKNKVYVFNNLASVFYCCGQMPYWIFMPKYIETQYRQNASVASFVTGTVSIVFASIGVLTSGFVIGKFKPKARTLALWNCTSGTAVALTMLIFMKLGCGDVEYPRIDVITGELNSTASCNSNCNCKYVPYSPVCFVEMDESFISPCHAGCTDYYYENETQVFTKCSCLSTQDNIPGTAINGHCPVDCTKPFYIFLAIVCLLNFIGASSRCSDFMIAVRCIDEADKSASVGFSVAVLSMLALVPAPIFFGYVLDTTCVVWGKTCSGKGNCWLYDDEQLRFLINTIGAVLVGIGTVFDLGVWVYVKDLNVFEDDNIKKTDVAKINE